MMRFRTSWPIVTGLLLTGCGLKGAIQHNSRSVNESSQTIRRNTDAVSRMHAAIDSLARLREAMEKVANLDSSMHAVAALRGPLTEVSELHADLESMGSLREPMNAVAHLRAALIDVALLRDALEGVAQLEATLQAVAGLHGPMVRLADLNGPITDASALVVPAGALIELARKSVRVIDNFWLYLAGGAIVWAFSTFLAVWSGVTVGAASVAARSGTVR